MRYFVSNKIISVAYPVRILILLSLLFAFHISANSQVTVSLQTPPPNQLRVSDLWNVTITNTTNDLLKIYLEGSVTESKDGLIVEGKSANFELKAHETKSFNPNNIGSAHVGWKNNRYMEIIIRTGGAPSGNYTICLFAKLESSGEEVGRDCKEQTVEITSPPMLMSPDNEATVNEKYPAFTWLPSPGAPPNTVYNLKIVEILGSQPPEEAMRRNIIFFEKPGIQTTIYQYPLAGKEFQPDHSYAWKVSAHSGNTLIGESEVWKFDFKLISAGTMITRQEAVSAFLGMGMVNPGSVVWPFKNDEPVVTISVLTWFGWVNDAPQAFFEHPTRYVLINAQNGSYEVLTKKWWPVLDGESLWMSEEEKENPAVLIYSDVNLH